MTSGLITNISNRIKVNERGNNVIHGTSLIGNYDTLCSLDANDSGIGTKNLGYTKKKITCIECKTVWEDALRFKKEDFA